MGSVWDFPSWRWTRSLKAHLWVSVIDMNSLGTLSVSYIWGFTLSLSFSLSVFPPLARSYGPSLVFRGAWQLFMWMTENWRSSCGHSGSVWCVSIDAASNECLALMYVSAVNIDAVSIGHLLFSCWHWAPSVQFWSLVINHQCQFGIWWFVFTMIETQSLLRSTCVGCHLRICNVSSSTAPAIVSLRSF